MCRCIPPPFDLGRLPGAIKWLVVVGLLLGPCQSHGGEKRCDPEDLQSCVQAVTVGEVVPFPGQLMTHRRAARLVTTTEQCADERALDLDTAHQLHQIQIQTLEERRDNAMSACELKVSFLEGQALEAERPWYEHPAVVAGITMVLTVAVFAAAVKTVEVLK